MTTLSANCEAVAGAPALPISRTSDADREAARRHRNTRRRPNVLPAFGLSLGYTLLYLGLIVLIPLSAAFIRTAQLTWPAFVDIVTAPRVLASYKLTFGMSLAAATINSLFGLLVAWVLDRYQFSGKRLVDAVVDLPFALPTAGRTFGRRLVLR